MRLLGGEGLAVWDAEEIDGERFARDFVRRREPVVFPAFAQRFWPESDRWSVDSFRERFGEELIPLSELKGKLSYPPWPQKTGVPFGKFLDTLGCPAPGTDDVFWYCQQQPVELFPGLQEDFAVPSFVPDSWDLVTNTVFVGCEGMRTSLHYDQPLVDNLFVQIRGEKRFRLFPPEAGQFFYTFEDNIRWFHVSQEAELEDPDLERFPEFPRGLERLQADVILEEGDMVYLPRGWWHHVSIVSPTAISMNFWYT